MSNEVWKDIIGFEGQYQISNTGNVKSLARTTPMGSFRREKMLKQMTDEWGYLYVFLYRNAQGKKWRVHRLVALAFVDNPNKEAFFQINHKDENPKNNNADNLEWCDCRYNVNYGTRTERASRANSGENCYRHKMTSRDVHYIRSVYKSHDKQFGAMPLAKKYGVHRTTIERLVRKKSWKYLEEE